MPIVHLLPERVGLTLTECAAQGGDDIAPAQRAEDESLCLSMRPECLQVIQVLDGTQPAAGEDELVDGASIRAELAAQPCAELGDEVRIGELGLIHAVDDDTGRLIGGDRFGDIVAGMGGTDLFGLKILGVGAEPAFSLGLPQFGAFAGAWAPEQKEEGGGKLTEVCKPGEFSFDLWPAVFAFVEWQKVVIDALMLLPGL